MTDIPPDAADSSSRDGRKRRLGRRLQSGSAYLSRAAGDDPAPEGAKPLVYDPARTHAVTDAEAIESARRRKAIDGGTARKNATNPAELPAPDAAKIGVAWRFPPLMMWRVHARAAIEKTTVTAVTEELLMWYTLGVPQDPDLVRSRQRALFEWFTRHDAAPAAESGPGVPAPGLLPEALTQRLQQEAQRRGVPAATLLVELLDRALGPE